MKFILKSAKYWENVAANYGLAEIVQDVTYASNYNDTTRIVTEEIITFSTLQELLDFIDENNTNK